MNSHPLFFRSLMLVPLSGLAFLGNLNAAEITWTGARADGNWTARENWDGDVPTPGQDSLLFAGEQCLSTRNDFPKGAAFTGITFAPDAGPLSLSGNTIVLAGNITNSSTNTQTINVFLNLKGDRTFATKAGGGDLVVTGIIGGPGGIAKTGDGTLTISRAANYTGATTISGGDLLIGSDGALPSSSGVVLKGGKLAFSAPGLNTTAGPLTVAANSTIDFKGGPQKLAFGDSHALPWTGALAIYNWAAADSLTFGKANDALTTAQLDSISFYSDAGKTLLGKGSWSGTDGRVVFATPAASK